MPPLRDRLHLLVWLPGLRPPPLLPPVGELGAVDVGHRPRLVQVIDMRGAGEHTVAGLAWRTVPAKTGTPAQCAHAPTPCRTIAGHPGTPTLIGVGSRGSALVTARTLRATSDNGAVLGMAGPRSLGESGRPCRQHREPPRPARARLLGEHLGQLLVIGWSVTLSLVIRRTRVLPRWLGVTGRVVSGASGRACRPTCGVP
jgi:hypothetical protein